METTIIYWGNIRVIVGLAQLRVWGLGHSGEIEFTGPLK